MELGSYSHKGKTFQPPLTYPNLKGIMASKRKPIESITVADMGIDDSDLKPSTYVTSYEPVPARAAGQKFEGEPEEIAAQVAQLLDTEANAL